MFVRKIYETLLKKQVRRIDDQLYAIRFSHPKLNSMYKYSVQSGKRFRPLLLLAACKSVGGSTRSILPAACAVELLHKASLVHDDLIDKDTHRRGKLTFHKKYGPSETIVMGDLLISLAYDQLSRLSVPPRVYRQCMRELAHTSIRLSKGELYEEFLREKIHVSRDDVEELILNKTASLIETCFVLGGILGEGSKKELSALRNAGRNIGLAFQTINDINNIEGIDKGSKKKLYSDISDKRKNFVVLHAMEKNTDSSLERLMKKKELNGKDIEYIVQKITDLGSLDHARTQVRGYLENARNSFLKLRPTLSRKLFLKVLEEAENSWFWSSN